MVTGDPFCWDQDDFAWGDRDITCIVNPEYDRTTAHGIALGSHDKPIKLPKAKTNQNTCTDNSTCVSDNSSNNDSSSDNELHTHTGGDDIICGNNSCTNVGAGGNTSECGDKGGGQ